MQSYKPEAFQKHLHFSTEYQKSFSAALSFWDSSFKPNVLLSITVSPSPLLSCLPSLQPINSLKRLPVWCNFMFLNTVFSGALLRKFNLLRNRSDTINRMKHKCSLWLPGESLCWVNNKIYNLQSCYQEKNPYCLISTILFLKIIHLKQLTLNSSIKTKKNPFVFYSSQSQVSPLSLLFSRHLPKVDTAAWFLHSCNNQSENTAASQREWGILTSRDSPLGYDSFQLQPRP